jgi:hypothetical protein
MTINKIEERKPIAIPQPQWTTQPPENRWDELGAAFPPVEEQSEDDFFEKLAEQSESYAAWEYYANHPAGGQAPAIEADADLHAAYCYGVSHGIITKQEETIMDGLEAAVDWSSQYDDYSDPIAVLREIARGRTMLHDTCTPEQARKALDVIWEEAGSNDGRIDAIARKALGWTERYRL